MIINFVGIKFLQILICFLSMIIYELLGIVFKVYYLQRMVFRCKNINLFTLKLLN